MGGGGGARFDNAFHSCFLSKTGYISRGKIST